MTTLIKKLFFPVVTATVVSVFFFSCEKDKGPIIIKPVTPVDTMISYSDYIQPVWDANCITCHNASHPFLDLRTGISYNELTTLGASAPYIDSVDIDNSLLILHLYGDEASPMPPVPNPPGLPLSTIDSIKQWMRQGIRDN